MAIYHFSGKIIGRSGGRSVVAAAAYRSGEKLFDERLGVFHNYSSKEKDVLHKEILAPEVSPAWVKSREKLWNEVEKVEKRKDAQLCREFVLSLPRELTLEQNIELGREFVQKEFVERGMITDVCWHDGKVDGKESQPHIHVMLSLREINEEGFGKKVREWNDKKLLLEWRESWANTVNKHLALAGLDVRIDHRTLEEQGIELAPQTKIGPVEGRERYSENVMRHEEIARQNGEKLYEHPEIGLKALTYQNSTFTHHDIARLVNRYTVDIEQFNRVYARIKSSEELVKLGIDNGQERYTTKEMLSIEMGIKKMSQEQMLEEVHEIQEKTRTDVLKRSSLSLEQQAAFKHITESNGLACVVGFAGTGKSYMLKAAREVWEKEGYQVIGMTLSGMAAEQLEESSGIKSYTVAGRLMSWENNNNRLNSRDVVVIDEAGMLGSRDVYKVMKEVREAGAKLVLIGDYEQLQPIQAGAVFRMIASVCGYVQMNEIRRQEVGWQSEATLYLATGQASKALEMYQKHNDVKVFESREEAIAGMIESWKQEFIWNKETEQIMLAYTRKDVEKLNMAARKVMEERGALGISYEIETERGKRLFGENERIYFLRNDKELGVKNGTIGTIREIKGDRLKIETEKGMVSFSTEDYKHLEYGYAATVYKAQGITVDKAHVLASPNYNRHATYVALSRHRQEVKLYWAKEDFSSFNNLKNRMGRAQNKDVSLDYIDIAKNFAVNRNIKVDFTGVAEKFKSSYVKEDAGWSGVVEDRLEARYKERMFKQDILRLKEQSGKEVSFKLEAGDRGKYLGIVKVGEERYGVIEQRREIKLVKADICEGLEKGRQVQIKAVERNQDMNRSQKLTMEPIQNSKKMNFEMER